MYSKQKFDVDFQSADDVCRTGNLDGLATPAVVLKTFHGSLMYTSNDLAKEIDEQFIAQIEYTDLVKLKVNVNELNSFPPNQINLFSLRNMNATISTATSTGVIIDTASGRKNVNVTDYGKKISMEKPSFAVAMADEFAIDAKTKRRYKGKTRTEEWYQDLIKKCDVPWTNTRLFGVSCGGTVDEREIAIGNILSYNETGGLCVGGLCMGESYEDRADILKLVHRMSTSVLSNTTSENGSIENESVRVSSDQRIYPILVQGFDTLRDIAHAVLNGVDLVSTNYPSILSNCGLVFVLPNDEHFNDSESSEQISKRIRLENSSNTNSTLLEITLNMWDMKYRADKTPLVEGCRCHACRNYSKGYIHHLLVAHELLGESMIYCHNQYSILKLFHLFRQHIKKGDFREWISTVL